MLRGLWVAWHMTRGLFLCAFVIGPATHFSPAQGIRLRTRLVRWWMCRLLYRLGVRVSIHGTPAAAPVLLVANHISWLDIPCLLGHVDTVFVAKQDVARWPLLGRLTACSGTLFIERGAGARRTTDQMMVALQHDQRVMIFPEGTSTHGRDLRPFHARLFEAAVATHSGVQAIAIRYVEGQDAPPRVPFIGDDAFLPHLWRLLGERRIEAHLTFCPTLSADSPRRALAAFCRQQIRTAIGAGSEQTTDTLVNTPSSPVQLPDMQPGHTRGPAITSESAAWKRTTRIAPTAGRA